MTFIMTEHRQYTAICGAILLKTAADILNCVLKDPLVLAFLLFC